MPSVLGHSADCLPVDELPKSTQFFMTLIPASFWRGKATTVTQLHITTGYSPSGVHYQLQILRGHGIVDAIPKRKGGKNCFYRLNENLRKSSEKVNVTLCYTA